ncbi:hypothetical protein KC8_10040 [Sphingomonas sp. KC8]|nr:hypothetical protein KC8_10040 [Sphingomonas sp. KC8]
MSEQPSRGTPRSQFGFGRRWIKIVGGDNAFREFPKERHVNSARASARLPAVPNLTDGPDGCSRSLQCQPLAFPPTAERVFRGCANHSSKCKRNAHSLTIACETLNVSTMSAEILQFVAMSDAPNRIRELRLAANLSQQKVGDAIGVSKVTISELELGKMSLTVDYMRRIAPVLGVTPAELLLASDNPHLAQADERDLLERYRAADDAQREQIQRVTEALMPYRADPRRVA